MKKWDKYECKIAFTTRNNVLIFNGLNVKELKLSDSAKITDLEKERENKITGKMIVGNPPTNDMYSNNFIEDLNKFSDLVGLKIEKDSLGVFYRGGNKKGRERRFSASIVEHISNLKHKISLDKVLTPELIKRIEKDRQEYLFVCSMLNELNGKIGIYSPICSYQLMDFLFKKDKMLLNSLKVELNYEERKEAEILMKEANKAFSEKTGFAVGKILDEGINKENGFLKYSGGDKRAYLITKKFGMGDDKSKIFLFIRALRNISAHFSENKDPGRISTMVNGFRDFIVKYECVYEETLRKMAYEWLGIRDGFDSLENGEVISADN